MTRIEKMLRRSAMTGYRLAVDRQSYSKIILTAYDGGKSITTEIYEIALKELESSGDRRILFAHSINSNSEDLPYLTWTRMTADADLKKLRLLELKVCGQMENLRGDIRFDGQIPIIECAVPVEQITCAGQN